MTIIPNTTLLRIKPEAASAQIPEPNTAASRIKRMKPGTATGATGIAWDGEDTPKSRVYERDECRRGEPEPPFSSPPTPQAQ